jgi:hypothetical protein
MLRIVRFRLFFVNIDDNKADIFTKNFKKDTLERPLSKLLRKVVDLSNE